MGRNRGSRNPGLKIGAALLAASALSTAAQAQQFGAIRVFGDSLSDPGNLEALPGVSVPAPFSLLGTGRFSNGPVWMEFLGQNLNVGAASSAAFGGAKTSGGNINPLINGVADTGLDAQLGAFLAGGGSFGPTDVAVFWGGANNYLELLPTLPALSPQDQQTAVVNGTRAAVTDLATFGGGAAQAGAREIVLFNLPDLGKTPASIAGGPVAVAGATSVTNIHNGLLAQAANQLAGQTGALVTVVDIQSLFDDVVANPGKYGFTDVTTPCAFAPGCLALPVDQQNAFLFVDPVHPNTAAHETIAAYFADTLIAPRTIAAQGEFARLGASEFSRRMSRIGDTGLSFDGDQLGRAFFEFGYFNRDREGQHLATGYDGDIQRVTAGFIAPLSDNVWAGIMGAYDRGNVELNSGLGGFDYRAIRVGGFAGVRSGGLIFQVNGSFGHDRYKEIVRVTGVANQIARGDTTGRSFAGATELRYRFGSERFGIGPLARFEYSQTSVDGYTESGAVGLNQVVQDRNIDAAIGGIGGMVDFTFEGDGYVLKPWFAATIENQFDGDEQEIATFLANVTETIRRFETAGTDESYTRLEGGLSFELSDRVTAQFHGELFPGLDGGDAFSAGGRVGFTF